MMGGPHPPEPLIEDWMARHRAALNFLAHLAGVPATFLGVLLIPVYVGLLSWPIFGLALGLFVGGYALQFLGHAVDGSEAGEIAAIRSWWRGRGSGAGDVVPVQHGYTEGSAIPNIGNGPPNPGIRKEGDSEAGGVAAEMAGDPIRAA